MPKCIVKKCRNGDISLGGLPVPQFRFPEDVKLREQWFLALDREPDWVPTPNKRVCIKHFTEVSISIIIGSHMLRT